MTRDQAKLGGHLLLPKQRPKDDTGWQHDVNNLLPARQVIPRKLLLPGDWLGFGGRVLGDDGE